MATYLIGDIQGCLDPLQRLLEQINFDPATDRLWPCGDLVNRGGHSLEVLRLLHGLGEAVQPVLGNHDLHLLAEDARRRKHGSRNAEFEAILQAPDRELLMDWLGAQPLASWSEGFGLLRVHAGVVPAWDRATTLERAEEVQAVLHSERRRKFLRKMYGNRPRRWREDLGGWRRLRLITNILCRIRYCDPEGRVHLASLRPHGKKKKGFRPWYRQKHRATRDIRIAYGHWAAAGLRIRRRTIGMDSGCVWGGALSAYRLEDDALFQEPGRR
ncbi:MAG: symmetrical bis(5'-nucleosyl)-tetraphosphatase [Pseudomonadota bacterium]